MGKNVSASDLQTPSITVTPSLEYLRPPSSPLPKTQPSPTIDTSNPLESPSLWPTASNNFSGVQFTVPRSPSISVLSSAPNSPLLPPNAASETDFLQLLTSPLLHTTTTPTPSSTAAAAAAASSPALSFQDSLTDSLMSEEWENLSNLGAPVSRSKTLPPKRTARTTTAATLGKRASTVSLKPTLQQIQGLSPLLAPVGVGGGGGGAASSLGGGGGSRRGSNVGVGSPLASPLMGVGVGGGVYGQQQQGSPFFGAQQQQQQQQQVPSPYLGTLQQQQFGGGSPYLGTLQQPQQQQFGFGNAMPQMSMQMQVQQQQQQQQQGLEDELGMSLEDLERLLTTDLNTPSPPAMGGFGGMMG
ncbi:hypothetical protein HDV05_003824 [Chytridiales sp. JEL 0842]|nr:hypothetical protein HDV05_003824 [Chytridiales sp. JEL 0842]